MQEKITVRPASEPGQFIIENNHQEITDNFENDYLRFGGYFGHHGPHKFAHGPVLYEALEDLEEWVYGYAQDYVPNDQFHNTGGYEAMVKARAALKLASGEV